jgi:putative ATPase
MFAEAREHARIGARTLLFVDEITASTARSRTVSCPSSRTGTVVLVGATTENPSFELNAALLSRAQVLILNRLDASRARHPFSPAPRRRRGARCLSRLTRVPR